MLLSEEQVLALAPDEPSKKAGKELAGPGKWVSKGANEQGLWGECQGSGKNPYQTQVDLTNIAFKCSCPSRKFPCKHGIGLMLLYARQKDSFTDTTPPAWVAEWLSKRSATEAKKAEAAEKPVDESAQAKRVQARERKVDGGIDELMLWIKDIVRNGLISMSQKRPFEFDTVARRMVDAQASGLGNMVSDLGAVNFREEGWQHEALDKLLSLYLVMQGYSQSDVLSEPMQQELRSLIGFQQNQEALKQQPGVKDEWLVLGKQSTQEENLIVDRFWLYGLQSQLPALILQFNVRHQSGKPQLLIIPGTTLQTELVFFPSNVPLRAIVKDQVINTSRQLTPGFESWQQVTNKETELFATMPVRSERPYVVQQLTPVQHERQWCLKDQHQQLMPIRGGFKHIWKLLALSGGGPLNMALLGKEKVYEPLGVWHNGAYKIL
jgi:hypothetical protein